MYIKCIILILLLILCLDFFLTANIIIDKIGLLVEEVTSLTDKAYYFPSCNNKAVGMGLQENIHK